MPESMSAERFIQKLNDLRSPKEQKKSERALEADEENEFMGIPRSAEGKLAPG